MPYVNKQILRIILVTCFLSLVTLLVMGQRFNFSFAGGTGYHAPRYATVEQLQGTGSIDHNGTKRPLTIASKIARGEIVTTNAGSYVELGFGSSHVALDERSTLTIIENDQDGLALNLDSGRLLATADSSLKIKTGQTESVVGNGLVSIINYDFLWRADVWPINTTVTITSPADGTFATSTGVQVATDDSIKSLPVVEDFTHGPSAAFYAWTDSMAAR